jgi:hypothetical protein
VRCIVVYYESIKREVKTRPVRFVYYESMKRELKTRPIYEFREVQLFIMNRENEN